MLKNESGLVVTISGQEIPADRPEPIISDIEVLPYNQSMKPKAAVEALADGVFVLIEDSYSNGLTILKALKEYLKKNLPNQSFQEQRDFRSTFRELSHKLLIEVYQHKIAVKKAPKIGWLQILYPEHDEFLLPFPQIQGLNSSWQWYEKGITIPGLKDKIHPFFGTYFPTRFEHLELFANWLKKFNGDKKSAFDIGIGSGVLSYLMVKHGVEKIYGTDSNPNAIIGISEHLRLNDPHTNIELHFGDLFANCNLKTDLIVFNPPWLPASHNSKGMDKAIYYDTDLFPRFFTEAEKHLKPNGRVLLLFSNLAQETKVTGNHPIEDELSDGGRFQKELLLQAKVEQASKKTRRTQDWRATELVELWVLKLKTH